MYLKLDFMYRYFEKFDLSILWIL